ncbi:lamin tail domain-containing protein [Paractinoplanes globisporus]|uniref:Lamin tail domain-containing protein n=1 Tax=Paractinoplanes globisporus TaxID=113565 RepID=A0ABW6WX29_9ACTN|nr:lamin tail domain-containing protein [Actinoplanes globisporus]
MKKRLLSLVSASAIGLGACLAAAAPAQAATPPIMLTIVYYNAPGTDTTANANVNGEYFGLKNTRSYALNLKNFTVRDKQNHVYTFTTSFVLYPGKSVYVHTGKGTNTTVHRYWGLGWHVWNNTGDAAYLRSNYGTLLDSCSWGSTGAYKYC